MEKLASEKIKQLGKILLSGRTWRQIWSKEWLARAISLLLAITLWYVVGREDIVDKNIIVPIEIINMPRDLVIANQFKKEIEVTVSGPRVAIDAMTSRSITRQINLSDATPGTNVINNDTDSMQTPRGITVLRVQPSSMILSLDKLVQKQFPVTPVTKGEVAAGYQLERLKMEPDVISITGPQTILAQVEELRTSIMDISGLKISKQIQVPLELEPAIVDLIGETSVTATITVALKSVEKNFNGVEVIAEIDGIRRKVTPAQVEVVVKIPVVLLKKGLDLRSLFTIVAKPMADEETLQLELAPRQDVQVPLDVVSIQPPTVVLVKEPEETAEAVGNGIESEEPADGQESGATAETNGKTELLTSPKKKIKKTN